MRRRILARCAKLGVDPVTVKMLVVAEVRPLKSNVALPLSVRLPEVSETNCAVGSVLVLSSVTATPVRVVRAPSWMVPPFVTVRVEERSELPVVLPRRCPGRSSGPTG